MLNSSAKENENVKRENTNETGIQDESQKCENFIDSLFNIQKTNILIKPLRLISIKILLGTNLICSQIVSLNT